VGEVKSAGSAYVFTRNGTSWTEQAHLVASVPHEDDSFGSAVAIDANTVAVGARSYSNRGLADGGLITFHRRGDAWSEGRLLLGDGTSDNLGAAVDIGRQPPGSGPSSAVPRRTAAAAARTSTSGDGHSERPHPPRGALTEHALSTVAFR